MLVGRMAMPHLPPGVSGTQVAAEAAATLIELISAAQAHDGLTLREFRAVTVSAQTASQYILGAAAAAQRSSGQVARWPRADLAWQAVRSASMVLDDERTTASTPSTAVGQVVVLGQAGLQHELGPVPLDPPSIRARKDLAQVLDHLNRIAHLLPVMADQLITVSRRWAKAGSLHARDDNPRADDRREGVLTSIGDQAEWTGPNLTKLLGTVELARSEAVALVEALDTATGGTGLDRRRA